MAMAVAGLLAAAATGCASNAHAVFPDGSIQNKISGISLYCVINGNTRQIDLTREDLEKPTGISVPGHVWGVVAFCDNDVMPLVGETPLAKIRENGNGILSIGYFGNVPARELPALRAPKDLSGHADTTMTNGYSLFPVIRGDALVPGNDFLLSFQSGETRFSIPVHQEGYRQLCTLNDNGPDDVLAFHYLGTTIKPSQLRSEDFLERLRAIELGIHNVESLFGMKLVEKVNIVDFNQLYGGVTDDGAAKTMWMYSRAILRESPGELTHMASHETLHRYVTTMGWTKSTPIRELFSEIKGYDLFSRERFTLVTRGIASDGEKASEQDKLFFSFINERNFLEGSRGGHSDDDLDEFCATFFHSLMYVGRLGGNLHHPVFICLPKGEVEKKLSGADRLHVLERYERAVRSFLDVASDPHTGRGLSMETTRQLLEKGLRNVQALQVVCAAEDNSPPQ